MSRISRSELLSCGLAAAFVLGSTLPAVPLAAQDCSIAPRPSASLLFPYFEVDLTGPTGRTTLLAIGNGSASAPALAHVVLWTDRGLPTLGFDLYLKADDVQTINLRDIFQSGTLPATGGVGFPTCSTPITLPTLGETERALLRAQHTGQPAGAAGKCWGSTNGGTFALGFVTVDNVNGCVPDAFPSDAGYFVDGGAGVASNANQLYGDFFLVAPEENYAQGNEAVHLYADADRFGPSALSTFYEMANGSRNDNRIPLPLRSRARYLNGGLFDGGTEIVLFAPYTLWGENAPVDCDAPAGGQCHQIQFQARNENSVAEAPFLVYPSALGAAITSRLKIGDAPVPVSAPFGLIDVVNQDLPACVLTPLPAVALPAFVMPVHSANGRLSVGLNATAMETYCDAATK